MPSLDPLLSKRPIPGEYECVQFLCDAWLHLTGQDITEPLQGFLLPPQTRTAVKGTKHSFKRLDAPQPPCILVCRRIERRPHVGMFWRGRVLHMNAHGAKHALMSEVRTMYPRIRFYQVTA